MLNAATISLPLFSWTSLNGCDEQFCGCYFSLNKGSDHVGRKETIVLVILYMFVGNFIFHFFVDD